MKELVFILLFVLGAYAIQFIASSIWNASCKSSDDKPVHENISNDSGQVRVSDDLSESIVYSHLPFNIWHDPYDNH